MPELLRHKKFQAGISGSVAIFLGQFIPAYAAMGDVVGALAQVNWLEVMAPIMTAIAAQGVADHGKEKAKVENGSQKTAAP